MPTITGEKRSGLVPKLRGEEFEDPRAPRQGEKGKFFLKKKRTVTSQYLQDEEGEGDGTGQPELKDQSGGGKRTMAIL